MTTPDQPRRCAEDCLHIDLGCPLFIEIKGVKERQKSNLVGMVPGAYLIVTKPQMVGVRSLLKQDASVRVRYLYMGEIFGFKTRAVGVIEVPHPLVFLSYPDATERINLRRTMRVACYLPAIATCTDRAAEGMIVDISSGGCRISVKTDAAAAQRLVNLEDVVELAFPLLGSEGNVQVQGIVRNLSEDPQGMTLGIQFQDVAGQIRDRIEAYTRRVGEFMDA